jgi:transcription elongation factor GreA
MLRNARVIDEDEISKTKYPLESLVTLRDERDKGRSDYSLVNASEAISHEPHLHRISGRQSILGKKKGQIVEVSTPVGT